jgi:hypothetical protein
MSLHDKYYDILLKYQGIAASNRSSTKTLDILIARLVRKLVSKQTFVLKE